MYGAVYTGAVGIAPAIPTADDAVVKEVQN